MKPFKYLLTAMLCMCGYVLYAQTPSVLTTDALAKPDTATSKKQASLSIAFNYTNNAVFMGRADQSLIPILSPELKYTFKPGIYINGSISSVPVSGNALVDGGSVGGGYSHEFTDNLSAEISLAKVFYSANSNRVASATRATSNFNLNYDIGDIISLSTSTDFNINRQGVNDDVFNEADISHEFAFDSLFTNGKGKLTLTPKFAVNFGTENFYSSFLVRKKLKNKKQNAAQKKLFTAYKASLSEYNLLDYEASLPLEFTYKQFTFTFTSTVAFAQNSLPPAVMADLSTHTTVFYFETGIAYKIITSGHRKHH